MASPYLEITFRKGKPMAAYLQLPRKRGDKAARTKEIEPGLVVDFAADGRPIGLEMTGPSVMNVNAINRVLKSLNQDSVSAEDLAPLTFAA
jgi:hypothetical protein